MDAVTPGTTREGRASAAARENRVGESLSLLYFQPRRWGMLLGDGAFGVQEGWRFNSGALRTRLCAYTTSFPS